MTILKILRYYNKSTWLRIVAHLLFWWVMWLFTQTPDEPIAISARLLEWGYSLGSYYILFYLPFTRCTPRWQLSFFAIKLSLLTLGSGWLMYWQNFLSDPYSSYDYLNDYRNHGVIAIFYSSRYFFYSVYNGFIVNVSGPSALKLLKTFYERQDKRRHIDHLTRQMQLSVLLRQISPHFLFNTLNNLYGLVLQNDFRSRIVTQQLATLLSYTDELVGKQWVMLRVEVQFIEDFIALARLRYSQEVSIEMQCELGEYTTSFIPPLLLLPLVENAFKHGLDQSINASWVLIKIQVKNKELIVKVANSCSKQFQASNQPGGLGLLILRERLRLLYPNTPCLYIEHNYTNFVAKLRLPLQPTILSSGTPTNNKST